MQGLYVITDGSRGDPLLAKTEQALRGGAALVQYRDKSDDQARREQEAAALRALCRDYAAQFIVNDDMALAARVQADGLHLGCHDAALSAARTYLGNKVSLGASCYNRLELAQQAQQQGADYVAFGSFFVSKTKPEAVSASLALLHQARQQLQLPICAIGGITLENAPTLVEAGADMLAVITDVFQQADIAQRAAQYQALLHSNSLPA